MDEEDREFVEQLEHIMLIADHKKQLLKDNFYLARFWAVMYTDLEKVLAYHIAYLEPKIPNTE